MDSTRESYLNYDFNAECDSEVCISELSASAIRGANQVQEIAAQVAFESVFNT